MKIPTILLWIIGLSLALHVVGFSFVVATRGTDVLIYGDAIGYIELAKNLISGAGFVTETPAGLVPQTFRTPGLPALLAPFIAHGSGLVLYLYIVTCTASILLPYLLWRIARRLFNERVALIAAALIAFEPLLIIFSWFPLTEIPFLIFSLSAGVMLLKSLDAAGRQKVLFGLFAGSLAAYAALIRPSNLMLFTIAFAILLAWNAKNASWRTTMAAVICMFLVVLAPWYVHMHQVTGVFAISGTGWGNVYTDYVSSVRSLKNGTSPAVERNDAFEHGAEMLGLGAPEELLDPANAPVVRSAAIRELWENKIFVLKLEPVLLFGYFTNDGWYYTASRVGLMPRLKAHVSPTRLLMDSKLKAVGAIFHQLRGQLFIPLIGRLATVAVVLTALVGVFSSRTRVVFFFALMIAIGALASTALGFGVEARLRISVMPLLFMLSAIGIDHIINLWKRMRTTR